MLKRKTGPTVLPIAHSPPLSVPPLSVPPSARKKKQPKRPLRTFVRYLGVLLVFLLSLSKTFRMVFARDPCETDIAVTARGVYAAHVRTNIPKIIHQQAREENDIQEPMSTYVANWRTKYSDANYMLWTDEKMRELIVEFYPFFLHIYE